MCESFRKTCYCGRRTAEIFFGKMALDEQSVEAVYCPECSRNIATDPESRVWDNGWVLELDMDVVRTRATVMGVPPDELTAEWVFDHGYATWVGITPDESEQRNRERAEIQKLAKTDLLAYYNAMKQWGADREERFVREGWRKTRIWQ